MAAMAETNGPSSRCGMMAYGFRNAGFEAATCMAEDVNYKALEGIPNYYLDIPMPLGLPKAVTTRTFPAAQKLGITSKKKVDSFDQVLRLTGNLDYRYLKKSVASVRKAIREYHPDIVYSEFNISAIIAAKKEGIPLSVTISYPTQHEYAHRAGLERGLNRLLDELQLPRVDSDLSLFDWADKSFCLSIPELEAMEKPGVIYCGSLKPAKKEKASPSERNKILVYMGNGTIPAKRVEREAKETFKGSRYEVYIASAYLEKGTSGNVHTAPRWDFDRLLEEAALFINHGGQNSVADGLINGVPQIMVPGKVFERKYNARCIADHKAGIVLECRDFKADRLRSLTEEILNTGEMADHAAELGRKLTNAGGINTIIRNLSV